MTCTTWHKDGGQPTSGRRAPRSKREVIIWLHCHHGNDTDAQRLPLALIYTRDLNVLVIKLGYIYSPYHVDNINEHIVRGKWYWADTCLVDRLKLLCMTSSPLCVVSQRRMYIDVYTSLGALIHMHCYFESISKCVVISIPSSLL